MPPLSSAIDQGVRELHESFCESLFPVHCLPLGHPMRTVAAIPGGTRPAAGAGGPSVGIVAEYHPPCHHAGGTSARARRFLNTHARHRINAAVRVTSTWALIIPVA